MWAVKRWIGQGSKKVVNSAVNVVASKRSEVSGRGKGVASGGTVSVTGVDRVVSKTCDIYG